MCNIHRSYIEPLKWKFVIVTNYHLLHLDSILITSRSDLILFCCRSRRWVWLWWFFRGRHLRLVFFGNISVSFPLLSSLPSLVDIITQILHEEVSSMTSISILQCLKILFCQESCHEYTLLMHSTDGKVHKKGKRHGSWTELMK